MLTSVQILHGLSRYDVFAVWEQALAAGFRELGITASIIPVHDERDGRGAGTLGVGFNLVRRWTAQHNGNRHLAWLVDHPIYHATLFMPEISGLALDREACAVACVDRHWAEFAREVYGFPDIFFVPHFRAAREPVIPRGTAKPFQVVFFGSLEDPQPCLRALERDAGTLWPVLRGTIEAYEDMKTRPPLDLFLLAAFRGVSPLPQQVRFMLNAFFPAVDSYFRRLSRIRLLQSIVRTPVHVFGGGSRDRFSFGANILFHDAIPFADVPAIMAGTRLLLNHTPSLAHGAHERIFEALTAGCLVHTTASDYLAACLGPDAGLSFYDPADLNDMDGQLAARLGDPAGAERVKAGAAIVERDHTALNRARRIAELYPERWPAAVAAAPGGERTGGL